MKEEKEPSGKFQVAVMRSFVETKFRSEMGPGALWETQGQINDVPHSRTGVFVLFL